jgi:LysM repeat protein
MTPTIGQSKDMTNDRGVVQAKQSVYKIEDLGRGYKKVVLKTTPLPGYESNFASEEEVKLLSPTGQYVGYAGTPETDNVFSATGWQWANITNAINDSIQYYRQKLYGQGKYGTGDANAKFTPDEISKLSGMGLGFVKQPYQEAGAGGPMTPEQIKAAEELRYGGGTAEPTPTQQPMASLTSPTPAPTTTQTPSPTPAPTSTYTGVSIVDYLKSVGQPSDFTSRATLAAQKGITNYTGTADQNTQLLGMLRKGGGQPTATLPTTAPTLTSTPTATPTSTPTAGTSGGQSYTVQSGDNLSTIAQRYGVSISDISGYRSGNPNLIYPGENLIIGKSVAPQQAQPTVQGTQQQIQQTEGQIADLQAQQQALQQYGLTDTEQLAKDASGNYVPANTQTDLTSYLGDLGIDVNSVIQPNQSPQKSITDLVKEVMTATGIPDAKANLEKISKEIEDITNEMNDEVAEINENPWLSEASRSREVLKMQEKYQNKIDSRTNQLKLYQSAYDSAKQEAQYAATLATNLYADQRDSLQSQMEFIMEQAEKAAELKAKAPETAGGGEIMWDATQQKWVPTGYTSTSDTTQTERGAIAIAPADQELRSSIGQGGFVDINTYRDLRAKYANRGIPVATFDSAFSDYLSASDRAKYGIGTATGETQTDKDRELKVVAFQKALPELQKNIGQDGFVDPVVYMKLRNDYVQAIGDVSEFDDVFSSMLSIKERLNLGVGKTTI